MTLSKDHGITMNDGNKIPLLGFGTFTARTVSKEMCEEVTKIAIEVGFRHFDGAYIYQTEEQVGRAIHAKISDGTVKREDIFYTGKLWSTFHRPELVRKCLEESLKKLQFDYMDLFLIHNPYSLKPGPDLLPMGEDKKVIPDNVDCRQTWEPGSDLLPMGEDKKVIPDNVDLRQTWEAMEACKDAGLVRSIGVSNFSRKHLEMILNKPGLKYKPVINQVECHPYRNQSKLLAFCKSNNIALEGYSVLGSQRDPRWLNPDAPPLLEDPLLVAIAKKYNKSPALVAIRYQLQRGLVVIVKSFARKRIEENIQAFTFQLSEEDMKSIDGLHRSMSYTNQKIFRHHPQYYPPEEE